MKIDYAEILINSQYSTGQGPLPDVNSVTESHTEWEQVKDTIQQWSNITQFNNFGINGGEPLLHPALNQWLRGAREILPYSHLVLITDGHLLRERMDVVEQMIQIAPSKLCIVLDENWQETVQKVSAILAQSGYRFFKLTDFDPIVGIQSILIDRKRVFDVEFYQHGPIQIRQPKPSNQDLVGLDLFQACTRRKSMPVLSDGRLFKCRKAAQLWHIYRSEAWISDCLKDAAVHYTDDLKQIERFISGLHEESVICQFCHGCIECVVHHKEGFLCSSIPM